ncbi:MAG: efflux RND transporter periplasmic adaptor subunit [Candidatus Zophobacter franzmannii]|nr:efflux RND transporter periplasmic adaptor subunit [Candidatus Zophobacter franzmannii]
MKKFVVFLIIVAVIALAFAGFYLFKPKGADTETSRFEFTPVKRGNIENIVTCTGTLEPIGSVAVGTELSGTVDRVYVDFNDVVKKNQVLAVLDTTQLSINVRTSRADLTRIQAQYDLSDMKYKSDLELHKKGFISDLDLQSTETNFLSAQASLVSAQATYEKHVNNLSKYAIIRSPINGTIINRKIEEGQTVASSYSTPTLFTIAEDLSKMQIYALVDESDIGQIKEGMEVLFTVESYQDLEFKGVAKQIRLQPQTVSNVVNYTVVVETDNKKSILLPGMTATVEFIVEQQMDVLMVQTSALKYQPNRDLMMEVMKEMRKTMSPEKKKELEAKRKERGAGGAPQGGMSGNPGGSGNNRSTRDSGRLWYEDESGKLKMARIKTGATDGLYTEVSGEGVDEGMNVIMKQKRESNVPGYMKRSLF